MQDFYVSPKPYTHVYLTTNRCFLKYNNLLSRNKAANLFKSINFSLREIFLTKSLICLVLLYALISSQYVLAQAPPTGFNSSVVSSQWSGAVGLTFNKTGNQMFVWEKSGKVWVMENNQKQLLLDISPEVGNWRDFGLLGFALHPQFETNGYFYLLYTVDRHHLINFGTANYNAATNEYYQATIGRVTRYTATKTTTGTGYTVNTASRKILLGATRTTGIPVLHESHGIGSLVFGTDGTLLISAGDGASYTLDDTGSATGTYYTQALADGIITAQENVGAFRAQLLESYNGKILRIDAETGNGIASNPFYNSVQPASARSKIWALGFRNPFRMSLRPNSGSTIPSDGKPGVLYVGDVGYSTWEEVNIVTKSGMNFGWPLYEGLTQHNGYMSKLTQNKNAPNPLYNQNGCTQQFFNFQDLLKQATASGTASFANPCNTTQTIPTTVKTFLHSRPAIDWNHNSVSARTGTFSGETATVTAIGATGSPVAGTQFTGNSVTAGAFYPHSDFPTEYRNDFFFGDYNDGWLRRMKTDATDKPTAVNGFITSGAVVVCMATHPTEPGLYYVNYPSEIRKVTYITNNQPPVAKASCDKTYGPSPLTIQFTGSASSDPEGQALTYLWNFGNGSTSTLANPTHSYTTATTAPTSYTVSLTVKDNLGSSNQTSFIVSANNTPPQVTITSPALNTLYPMSDTTIYNLRANVTDLEHTSTQLRYEWQTTLYHNEHNHPETPITTREGTTTISPVGCDGNLYFYRISLKVTDGVGLATTKFVDLYPDCNKSPSVAITSPTATSSYTAPATIVISANAADTDGTVSKVEFYNGTTKLGEDALAPYSYSWGNVAAGTYSLRAKAIDNKGAVTTSAAVGVTVKAPAAPVVAITSPAANASFTAPANISISANASDTDGTVTKVEFFNGTTKLGEDLTSPYSFTWNNVPAGTYSLTAKATDNTSKVTTSAAVSITVKTASAPTVSITAPTNNATFTAPANITITANAADPDGTITKVEFFRGTTKLGEDLTSPYSYTWSNAVAGAYTITAKATDNSMATTTSTAVNITVKQKVLSFLLIEASTGRVLQTLTNGSKIVMATLPSKKINIRATTSPGTVGSVAFNLTGTSTQNYVDNTASYHLVPDKSSTSSGFWVLETGSYTLKATPYTGANATGMAGINLTISFSVVKNASSTALLSTVDEVSDQADMAVSDLTVSYYPNPFINEFTLEINGKQDEKIPVEIYDAFGELVLTLKNVPGGKPIKLGKNLNPGSYTMMVGKGKETKQYKLLKIQ